MVAVRQLYDLQGLDLETASREKSLAEVREGLADDSALVSARNRAGELKARLDELGSSRRALERTIAELEERLQRVESRLYGGAVTNPKEMTAAEEERAYVTEQRRQEEDRLLEVMVELDETDTTHKEAQEALKGIEVERPTQVAQLTGQEEDLSKELLDLERQRALITDEMPARTLSLYESLRKSKNGQAVARVERGLCQGCRLSLSTQDLRRARGTQAVVQCSSCRRILYVV